MYFLKVNKLIDCLIGHIDLFNNILNVDKITGGLPQQV